MCQWIVSLPPTTSAQGAPAAPRRAVGYVEAPDKATALDVAQRRFYQYPVLTVQSRISSEIADTQTRTPPKAPSERAGWRRCACGTSIRRGANGIFPSQCAICARKNAHD